MEIKFNIWIKFFEVIQELQAVNSKDSNVHLMIEEIKNEDKIESMKIKNKIIFFFSNNLLKFIITFYFADNKAVKILHLLPHFIPPKRLIGRGKKVFKPSIAIAQQSMIKHVHVSICYITLFFYIYMVSFILYFNKYIFLTDCC